MITYDELYTLFISTCSMEGLMLPKNDEQRYDVINSAVMRYNNRLRTNLKCDDEKEQITSEVEGEVSDDAQLIIAHFMRLILLNNALSYKNTIFTTFTKEIGVRNINSQTRSLQAMIENEEKEIDFLVFYADESSIM